MPEKVVGSPAEAAGRVTPEHASTPDQPAQPAGNLPPAGTLRAAGNLETRRNAQQDDGLSNPRDGRGPLRRCDDQAAKLPLRPPH